MRRRTFDALATTVGLVLAIILLAAGGLMLWGHSFVDSQVHNQLAAQKIVFPANGSPAIKAPEFAAMHQYAGQLMTTGAQAEVYADHFIANHLKVIGGGQTYAQLSGKALTQPNNVKLQAQVETMFKGTTLRSMLLSAYAFGKMGQLALWGAIVAFAGRPAADPVRARLRPPAPGLAGRRGVPAPDREGSGHDGLIGTKVP